MKAIIWTAYGKPDVLKFREIETPIPKDNEVFIKIHTTAATTGDCRLRGFRVPLGFWLPTRLVFGLLKPRKSILGMDFSGEVESVGKRVSQFKIGDRVCGSTGIKLGANAEYICLAEDHALVKIPDDLSYKNAVAIIFGGLTAVHFLRDKVNIQSGQRILINGASGAVGTAAVQLSKYYGADVTGVCSASNHKLVTSIGADRVIDYTKENFVNNGETYDAILDTVGNLSLSKCNHSLVPRGKLVLINTGLLTNLRSVTNAKLVCGVSGENKESLSFLMELVSSGRIVPVIDSVHPLQNIPDVHRYIDKGHKRGNVVIVVERETKI
jgi:NADPH:quinone reductase-like Zn-dependent oxidoreductase